MSKTQPTYEAAQRGSIRNLGFPTHTHTHTALRRLRVARLCAVMGLYNSGLPVPGWAQVVYPNPAGSWIRMVGDEALRDYTISDATGRDLRIGSRLSAGEAINLTGLICKFYLLHAAKTIGVTSTYTFIIK